MEIKRALVVYKKSSYQKQVLEERSTYYRRLLRQKNLSVRDWHRLHKEHQAAIRLVERCLKNLGIQFKAYNRFEIKTPIKADVIITVGGDGTFLEAAHYAKRELMFGVNSTPSSSVGHFSAVHVAHFEKKLEQVLAGKGKQQHLQRLQAYHCRRKIGPPVLNEILFTSQNAGGTSRYWIRKNKGKQKGGFEEHKSSGIWIATPAGSTAAIHSAGGRRLPIEAIKFSYRVRELYRQRGVRHRIRSGILGPKDAIQITSKMEDGTLYIDGSHVMLPVRRGETITFQLSSEPLRIVA